MDDAVPLRIPRPQIRLAVPSEPQHGSIYTFPSPDGPQVYSTIAFAEGVEVLQKGLPS